MARRMFSPEITGSDAFMEMAPSTQALYFQLGMRADDDGFVSPKMVMRMMGSTEDELKVLMAKRFVLRFENGVVVIKHWRINNLIRKDWYRPTIYIELRNSLFIKENGAYTDNPDNGTPFIEYVREHIVNEPFTQDRLGKDRLGKDSKVSTKKKPTLPAINLPTPAEVTNNFFKGVQDLMNPNAGVTAHQSKEMVSVRDFLANFVSRYPNVGKDAIWGEIKRFYAYWTERTKSGKKQRWETEKTFEVDRRLTYWLSRNNMSQTKLPGADKKSNYSPNQVY